MKDNMERQHLNRAIEIISVSNSPKVSFNVPVRDNYSTVHDIIIHEFNARLIRELVEEGFSIGRATVSIEYLKKGEVYLYKPVHQQGKALAFKLTYIPNRNAYYHYPISFLNSVSYDTELSLSEKAKIYQTLVHITQNKE